VPSLLRQQTSARPSWVGLVFVLAAAIKRVLLKKYAAVVSPLVNQGKNVDIYAEPLMGRPYSLVCYGEANQIIGRLNRSPEAGGRLIDGAKLWEYTVAQDVAWHEAFDLLRGSLNPKRHQAARKRLEEVFARVEVVK
jgi:hypothetical protein